MPNENPRQLGVAATPMASPAHAGARNVPAAHELLRRLHQTRFWQAPTAVTAAAALLAATAAVDGPTIQSTDQNNEAVQGDRSHRPSLPHRWSIEPQTASVLAADSCVPIWPWVATRMSDPAVAGSYTADVWLTTCVVHVRRVASRSGDGIAVDGFAYLTGRTSRLVGPCESLVVPARPGHPETHGAENE